MKGKIGYIIICCVMFVAVVYGAIVSVQVKRTDAQLKQVKEELWAKNKEMADVKTQLEEKDAELYEMKSQVPELIATSEDAEVALKILENSIGDKHNIDNDLADVEKLRELFKKNALDDTWILSEDGTFSREHQEELYLNKERALIFKDVNNVEHYVKFCEDSKIMTFYPDRPVQDFFIDYYSIDPYNGGAIGYFNDFLNRVNYTLMIDDDEKTVSGWILGEQLFIQDISPIYEESDSRSVRLYANNGGWIVLKDSKYTLWKVNISDGQIIKIVENLGVNKEIEFVGSKTIWLNEDGYVESFDIKSGEHLLFDECECAHIELGDTFQAYNKKGEIVLTFYPYEK